PSVLPGVPSVRGGAPPDGRTPAVTGCEATGGLGVVAGGGAAVVAFSAESGIVGVAGGVSTDFGTSITQPPLPVVSLVGDAGLAGASAIAATGSFFGSAFSTIGGE